MRKRSIRKKISTVVQIALWAGAAAITGAQMIGAIVHTSPLAKAKMLAIGTATALTVRSRPVACQCPQAHSATWLNGLETGKLVAIDEVLAMRQESAASRRQN